jgi:DNA polymerase (family 10)
MRKIAIDNGLRLNEFGLIPEKLAGGLKGVDAAKHTLSCESEADIYSMLGLQWVAPELREDMGEIEAAAVNGIPDLIESDMIRGALHNHTVASDGSCTLEEMASAAMDLGWEYLGIAEHSRALNEKWADRNEKFRIFHGTECDILPDGKLDYSPDVRNQFHHVIGSVHAIGSWRSRDEQDNTDAIIKAVEDPTFTILGHPTGRILQARDGFPIDMIQIIEKMGEINSNGTLKAIEINASPFRLDLDWRLCKVAKENGVPIVINPDAHSAEGLSDVSYGVDIARKGWLRAEDVLNTRSGDELDEILGE